MARYINFLPGNMEDKREINITEHPACGMAQDLGEFIDAMEKGYTASIKEEGIKEALEDGEALGKIQSHYGMDEDDLKELVEELHSAL